LYFTNKAPLMMESIIEIAKWLLPAILVFIAVWMVFENSRKSELKRYAYELRSKGRQTTLPIQLKAHERMMLFLERINPEALIMRLQRPNLTVQELHGQLLKTIRQEWDHNVSQQLYISDEAWQQIKIARENVVKLVNTEAGKLKQMDPAIKLSQMLIEESNGPLSPIDPAIKALKADIRQLF